jgi:Gas vesicle synthesis protein GvpL/GvpF
MSETATYLYCLVESEARPSLARAPRGLPGLGKPRAVDAGRDVWLICADAPLDRYGEEPIEKGLRDLDWVSQCAMGHEGVIESVLGAGTVLPMKLFTLFASDQRALGTLGKSRARIDRALGRLRGCDEYGVRLRIDEKELVAAAAGPRAKTPPQSGTAFLQRKKSLRDAAVNVRKGAREHADDLHEALAKAARDARRRPPEENPLGGPRLVLDAAYLIERKSLDKFRKQVEGWRAELGSGYELKVSGPWPAYHFVADVA